MNSILKIHNQLDQSFGDFSLVSWGLTMNIESSRQPVHTQLTNRKATFCIIRQRNKSRPRKKQHCPLALCAQHTINILTDVERSTAQKRFFALIPSCQLAYGLKTSIFSAVQRISTNTLRDSCYRLTMRLGSQTAVQSLQTVIFVFYTTGNNVLC